MTRRQHFSELIRATAKCQRCSFEVTSSNAQALAAKHHDAKGHRITVETTTRLTYGVNLGKARAGEQKELI